jgi:hypothetical protein
MAKIDELLAVTAQLQSTTDLVLTKIAELKNGTIPDAQIELVKQQVQGSVTALNNAIQ